MQILYRYLAHMEEKANKLHFYRLYLCYSSTNFDIFSVYNSEFFPILIANNIFHVTSITFAINLWHREFVTADVTAVFVNNQHGIQ